MTMLVVTLGCQTQSVNKEVKNDLLREGLKGNVKTMTVTEYDFDTDDDGNVEKEWERKVRKSYNRHGYMVEECRYYEDGSLNRKTTVERDSLGIAIKRQLHFNGDGELLGTGIYSYDDNGNLAEIATYDHSGNMTDRLSYVYDNKGNQIEEKHQMLLLLNGKSSVAGEFVSKGECKDGLLHKKEAYQDGKKIAEHRMTYNAAGKIEGQTTFDGDGDFRWRHVFHYNEQGDAYKWIGYSESGKVRAEGGNRFEYDSQGNAIKKQSCQNGELISEEIREMEYY
jgi:hypothetical protein